MKTVKTIMRQRAREIIEETSKNRPYFADYFFASHLKKKIETCDKVVEILKKGRDIHDLCPFPKKKGLYGPEFCSSCAYFFKGTTDSFYSFCGCVLIARGTITINQAVDGLRIFKSEMKKYLEEKQRRPGA